MLKTINIASGSRYFHLNLFLNQTSIIGIKIRHPNVVNRLPNVSLNIITIVSVIVAKKVKISSHLFLAMQNSEELSIKHIAR